MGLPMVTAQLLINILKSGGFLMIYKQWSKLFVRENGHGSFRGGPYRFCIRLLDLKISVLRAAPKKPEGFK